MKNTGIVRRIDELGRIVLPKELRRRLKLRPSSEMEIFIEGEKLILEKYSSIEKQSEFIESICSAFLKANNIDAAIADFDEVKFSSKSNLVGKTISNEIVDSILSRKQEVLEECPIFIDGKNYKFIIVTPIILNGDINGAFITMSNDNNKWVNDVYKNSSKVCAEIICANLE